MKINTGANIFPLYLRCKKHFKIFSMCLYKLESSDFDNKDSFVSVDNKKFNIKFLFKKGIRVGKNLFFNIYSTKFEYDKLIDLPIQNTVIFNIGGHELTKFLYDIFCLRYSIGSHSRIHNYKNMDMCTYIRQAGGNIIGITVRNRNVTDRHFFKILAAWVLALFSIKSKIILLFEKNVSKYEESAASVYEKLIDNNKKAYFILREDSKHWIDIKEKYRKNIIKAYTFKHYYYYFKCKRFIGSESIYHAVEIRTINRFVNIKQSLKRFKYVFLQHGVMYMVSLDSNNRHFFRKDGQLPKKSKVVVSSKLEAQHFIDLGGFTMDDLYITGLPFFDRTIKKDGADKIVIMITWRSWDYNTLESDYKKSTYYNMTLNILNSIPKEYKDKVWVLPHPLVKERFEQTDLKKYIPEIISYDRILEDTNLLITDYSSIAYSAFYRGSNVIFCWMEKDECMKEYGGHLMLNDKNTFGDICYEYDKLGSLIKKNYMKVQEDKYIKNYRKIVEFHDGNNTQRVYECLVKDRFFD